MSDPYRTVRRQVSGRLIMLVAVAAASALPSLAAVKNGFDLADGLVPEDEIYLGGPPRDGIPAIDNPKFETAEQADWMKDGEWIIGVAIGDEAKAYPIRIMNWHEIVNDTVGGEPVLVTFCPLCGTGIVFAPPAGGRLDFGVSGLLYNSDVLLYDRQTGSLWSQILAQAVTGERKGAKLAVLSSQHTKWSRWLEQHPHSQVLSLETGFVRDYDRDPYAGYEDNPRIFYPIANRYEGELHNKERILGVVAGDAAKAYPFSALQTNGVQKFEDTVGGEDIIVHWDPQGPAAWAETASGEHRESIIAFWFAWYAFHPETEIFQ